MLHDLWVSCSHSNNLPQTWWLTTGGTYFFTSLQARGLKSGYPRVGSFWVLREKSFLPHLLVSRGCANPWCSFIYSQITLISTPSSYYLHHHHLLISFLPFSSLVMMLVIHLGPLQTSMISSEILNYMFKDAFFQISSHLQVSVWHIFWGSPCAPHTWYVSDVSQYNVSDLSPPTPFNPLSTAHLALFSFSLSSMPTNFFLCPVWSDAENLDPWRLTLLPVDLKRNLPSWPRDPFHSVNSIFSPHKLINK